MSFLRSQNGYLPGLPRGHIRYIPEGVNFDVDYPLANGEDWRIKAGTPVLHIVRARSEPQRMKRSG